MFGNLEVRTILWFFLAGTVIATQVSIAASQCLLALTIGTYIWHRVKEKKEICATPAFAWPLLGLFLWTVLSVLLSSYLQLNLASLKKFILFSIAFMVPGICRFEYARVRIYYGLFVIAGIASAVGLVEYFASRSRDLDHRVTGMMSHWMTYSGLLMLIVVALCAYLVSYGLRRSWWAVPLSLMAGAGILLSHTRSTLAAAILGTIAVLMVSRCYKGMMLFALAASLLFLSAPELFRARLKAGFDADHEHTRPRIELVKTGLRMIRSNPIAGVGPGSVSVEAQKYKSDDARPEWTYIHLHNNMIQIAAERGLPGLLLWLWFMWRLAADSFKRIGSTRISGLIDREQFMVSLAAFGAIVALFAGGMLEYNFGDSEILMLFLFMTSAPYADAAGRKPTQEAGYGGQNSY